MKLEGKGLKTHAVLQKKEIQREKKKLLVRFFILRLPQTWRGSVLLILILLPLLILLLTLFQFGSPNCRLIIHQSMKSNNRPQQTAQIHDQHLIVRTRCKALCQYRIREVRQEIERVLQVIYDLVVNRHFTCGDFHEVFLNIR